MYRFSRPRSYLKPILDNSMSSMFRLPNSWSGLRKRGSIERIIIVSSGSYSIIVIDPSTDQCSFNAPTDTTPYTIMAWMYAERQGAIAGQRLTHKMLPAVLNILILVPTYESGGSRISGPTLHTKSIGAAPSEYRVKYVHGCFVCTSLSACALTCVVDFDSCRESRHMHEKR
jgi:hypothetical protein